MVLTAKKNSNIISIIYLIFIFSIFLCACGDSDDGDSEIYCDVILDFSLGSSHQTIEVNDLGPIPKNGGTADISLAVDTFEGKAEIAESTFRACEENNPCDSLSMNLNMSLSGVVAYIPIIIYDQLEDGKTYKLSFETAALSTTEPAVAEVEEI